MKFNFVVYRGGDFSNQTSNQSRKPEGSITVESNRSNNGKGKDSMGDYVDYEEVK